MGLTTDMGVQDQLDVLAKDLEDLTNIFGNRHDEVCKSLASMAESIAQVRAAMTSMTAAAMARVALNDTVAERLNKLEKPVTVQRLGDMIEEQVREHGSVVRSLKDNDTPAGEHG